MIKKRLKRYTVGFGDDGDWIDNTTRASSIHDADFIVIPGGIDVSPTYYKEPRGMYTQVGQPSNRDIHESKALRYSFNEGKYVIGICRGLN